MDRMKLVHNHTALVTLTFICVGLLGLFLLLVLASDMFEDALIDNSAIYLSSFSNLAGSILLYASQSVTTTISNLGYPGIFLLMFLESTSLPIPSEVILPFSGYLASTGRFDAWAVVLLSTAAGIAGSLVDYYLGLKASNWGRSRILKFFSTEGSNSQFDQVERWFYLHGAKAVFFTRMIPGVRTLVSFPAGAARMHLTKFVAYTSLGCFLWSTLLVYLGLYLGSHWSDLLGIAHYASVTIIVAGGSSLVLWLAVGVLRRKKEGMNPCQSKKKC